ncbi:MAG TPA: FHA domain-containing protein, partial [Candidatus Xenobia bacterium]
MNYRLQTYVGTMMGIHAGTGVSQDAVEPIRWTPLLDSGYEILIEDGQERGKTIPLDSGLLLIGREEVPGEKRAGWLLFADRSVSRRQALLWWDAREQTYDLVHVDSATNPTLIDHHPEKTALLRSGQHVKSGHLGFRLHRRPLVRPNNPVIRSAMGVVGDVRDTENWVDTGGLALTVVEGDGQGQTFLLNKNYHLLGARS